MIYIYMIYIYMIHVLFIKIYHLLYAFIGIPPQRTFSKPSFLLSICQISGGESKVLPFNPGGQPFRGKIIITSLMTDPWYGIWVFP